MISKKSSVISAAVLALCCVVSAVYISSCTKPSKGPSCDGYACENGGYCSVDTFYNDLYYPLVGTPHCDCPKGGYQVVHCNCPAGFEGPNCATVSVAKYLGTWDVKQTVIGSDSIKTKGTDSLYSVLIQSTTPTSFTIYNLCGDKNYNDVICTLDSIHSGSFIVDTTSAFHMIFDHFKQTSQGFGYIVPGDSIVAILHVRHLNYNINWQNDTLAVVMTPHH